MIKTGKSYYLTVCIGILSLIFCNELFSQFSLGFYGGVSGTNLAGDGIWLAVYRPGVGWNAGITADIPLSHDIALLVRPGITINNLRVQAADTLQLKFRTKLEYRDSVKLNLNSFNLPVLVSVITDNRRFRFTSGIELAYLFSARWDNGAEIIDVQSKMDNFNMSIVFGVGYIIPLKNSRLSLDVLYTQGIRNLSASSVNQSVLPRIKTKGFRLNIFWTYPLQKISPGQK